MVLPSLSFAGLEDFRPENALTVMEPERPEQGYWVGCPSVTYEPEHGRFLMTYRQRRPRGAAVERGWRCAIAESTDGVGFRDIWSVEKAELSSSSMERFALVRHNGEYLLYVSYVDPDDNRWRIDVLRADQPDKFDIDTAVPAMTAATTGTEGVKDPVPVIAGPSVIMFVSYAAASPSMDRSKAHGSADVYNTGMTTGPTGMAISQDGENFDWRADVLPVGTGWDAYSSRITTVVPLPNGFAALYDGSANVGENYEERTGLAYSGDLAAWTRLTPHVPWRTSAQGSGSLRYASVVPVRNEWYVYFEATRAEGAHDIRLTRVPR